MSGAGREDVAVSAADDRVRLTPAMELSLVQAERNFVISRLRSEIRSEIDGASRHTLALKREWEAATHEIGRLQHDRDALLAGQRNLRGELEAAQRNDRDLKQALDALLGGQRNLRREQKALREGQIRTLAGLTRGAPQTALPKALRSLKRLLPNRGAAIRQLRADYQAIAASALFDARWYLASYPDVAASGGDPAWHYLVYGGAEGRAAGPDFDSRRYLDANPDVAQAGANPLLHFLRYGALEQRPLGLFEDQAAPAETQTPPPPELQAPPAAPVGDARPARRLNDFVYDECRAQGIPFPDIPVYQVEQYGQCAEDLIVSALLQAWSSRHGVDLSQATYLEIGGNHPVATSASFLLHRVHGMRGVVIEANPDLIPALQKVRDFDRIVYGAMQADDVDTVMLSVSNLSELSSLDPSFVTNWAGGSVGERAQIQVPALRINGVIESYFNGVAPHFLSIDIESLDLPVMQDLDLERYRPIVIQAEPSDHHCPGNTGHMIEFMRGKNYALVAKTPVNLVFIAIEALTDGAPRAVSPDAWRRHFAPDYLREEAWSYQSLDAQLATAVDNRIGQLWLGIKDGHKWLNYFDVYEKCFADYVGKDCRVLEIGVNKGASLELWKRYFGDRSCLVGIDIVPECAAYEDTSRNIHVRIGSQADPDFLRRVAAEFGPFDIIIDDGSHVASHQIASFNALFLSALKNGGVYLIEDVETAYWGRRTGQLDNDFSIVDYANAVVNLMHRPYCDHDYPFFLFENAGAQTLTVPNLTRYVDQVRFFDSVIVFNKNERQPPVVKYIGAAPAP